MTPIPARPRSIPIWRLVYFIAVLPLLLVATAKAGDILIGSVDDEQGALLRSVGPKRHIVLREHQPSSRLRFPRVASDPAAGYVDVETDSNGFIKPSAVHPDADLTVVFLGGSTTECLMLDAAERFPYLVGRMLETSGRKVNTFNGGVSGNTTMHALNIMVNKVVPMSADAVVLMETINDLSVLMYAATYWNDNPTRRLVGVKAPDALGDLYGALRDLSFEFFPNIMPRLRSLKRPPAVDEWAEVRGRPVEVNAAAVREQYRRSLLSFVRLARVHAMKPVLMTQPRRVDERDGEGMAASELALADIRDELFGQLTDTVREVAKTEDVLLIDLNATVPWTPENFSDTVHYTASGARLVAERVSAAFGPMLAERRPLPRLTPE